MYPVYSTNSKAATTTLTNASGVGYGIHSPGSFVVIKWAASDDGPAGVVRHERKVQNFAFKTEL